MDPLNHDKHRRRTPFDLVDDEFDRLFDEIPWMSSIQEMIDEISNEIDMPNRTVYGLCIEIEADGKTRITEFADLPLRQRDTKSFEERKMVTDIIEDDKEVAITVELPGVEREDINLNVTKDSLEITVDNPKRKHHKRFGLPCSVKPNTMKSTYKNGVLDVSIKKEESGASAAIK